MTELRRRMLDELRLRNYSPHTQRAYIRCVADFAKHFRATPDRLGPRTGPRVSAVPGPAEKALVVRFNQTVCALRFFYHDVLHRNWMIEHIPYPRHEQKLPVVLSPAEVAALFQSTLNLKHRAILMTIYAAGLRVSELINLRRDRYRQPAPAHLLSVKAKVIKIARSCSHRSCSRCCGPTGNSYRPKIWLFPGANAGAPMTQATVWRICQQARNAAHLTKPVSPHTLAALLRDPSAGRGDRSAPHPDSDGASQPEDYRQVSARFQPGSTFYRQPAGSTALLGSDRSSMTAPALELADIFRIHGPAYLDTYGASLSAAQRKALERHRSLSHRRARWPRRTMRPLRPSHDRLLLLPQSPLSKVSERRPRGVARPPRR